MHPTHLLQKPLCTKFTANCNVGIIHEPEHASRSVVNVVSQQCSGRSASRVLLLVHLLRKRPYTVELLSVCVCVCEFIAPNRSLVTRNVQFSAQFTKNSLLFLRCFRATSTSAALSKHSVSVCCAASLFVVTEFDCFNQKILFFR